MLLLFQSTFCLEDTIRQPISHPLKGIHQWHNLERLLLAERLESFPAVLVILELCPVREQGPVSQKLSDACKSRPSKNPACAGPSRRPPRVPGRMTVSVKVYEAMRHAIRTHPTALDSECVPAPLPFFHQGLILVWKKQISTQALSWTVSDPCDFGHAHEC